MFERRRLAAVLFACTLGLVGLSAGGRPTGPTENAATTTATVPVSRAVASDPWIERVSSDVAIRVDGERRVARVEIEEVFRNVSGRLAEADYLVPVAPGAVFTGVSLFAGDRELRGEVMPADRARGIYEEIVRRKRDPALIELVGRGVLRARVFPIAAGGTRRIVLRFEQLLGRDGDTLRLRFPRLVGMMVGVDEAAEPRPLPAARPGLGAAFSGEGGSFSLTMTITGAERFATPYSPTHAIEVRERGGAMEVSLARPDRAPRDFDLLLPLRGSGVGATLLTHARGGEPGWFMLLLSPPRVPSEETIPRDVTLVIDTSGSMSGGKLEQARAAVEQVLGGLRPDDRFRLIAYDSVVRVHRREAVPATRAAVEEARAWLANAVADGSTNIEAALLRALEPETVTGRMTQLVFLTDGKPTVGETSPERILERVRSHLDGERVFTFGVGHDVNTWVLDVLAAEGRGTPTYVAPGEDVERAVATITRKLRFPALSDLRIVSAPATLEDLWPAELPDLFYGEELVLLGRYRGHGDGELVIEGRRRGGVERIRHTVALPGREDDNGFVPKLWATRKAGALAAQIRLNGPDLELVEEIRELGLRYGIVTEYSSYLVEEPDVALRPEELVRRVEAARAPAAAQSGAVAFRRSDSTGRMREVSSVEAAEEALADQLPPLAGDDLRAAARRVGGKAFALRDGAWVDVGVEPDADRLVVAPFSDAWFELARALPELRPYLALGERVIIAGDSLVLESSPEGVSALAPGDLDALRRAFR